MMFATDGHSHRNEGILPLKNKLQYSVWYKAKPTVVKALQWTRKNHADMFFHLTEPPHAQDERIYCRELITKYGSGFSLRFIPAGVNYHFTITNDLQVLCDGKLMVVSIWDWVILHSDNRYSICSPDTFEDIYEKVYPDV